MNIFQNEQRTICFYIDVKYLVGDDRKKIASSQKMEKTMNYYEATAQTKEGKRVRRPTWQVNEYMWSNGKVLIHTTPYWTNEKINQELNGYPYVCEQVDVVASDWTICE